MKTKICSLLALVMMCGLAGYAQAGDGVGKLKELAGTARVTHVAAGQAGAQDMKMGDPVFAQDIVETEKGTRAVFAFVDEAELVVTGEGKLVVDEYIYDAEKKDGNKASLGILGTAFSYVGGLMDKSAEEKVKLRLDYGAIGIRGTKVMGVLRNGLDWVYLAEGAATVDNKGGKVALEAGFGTRMISDAEAPSPAYMWGEAEIAWLQRLVDDPSSHETPAMASNMPGKVKRPEAVEKENEAPSGGGAALERRDMESGLSAAGEAPAEAAMSRAESSAPTSRARAVDDAVQERQPSASAPVPAPAAPAQLAKAKTAQKAGALLSWDKISPAMLGTKLSQEADDALRVETKWPVTINLAQLDVAAEKIENTVLAYTAELKALEISGTAYLEMWVHFPGEKGGWFFSSGLDNQLTKEGDWQSFSTPFTLQAGQVADKVTLNLVINGKATVLARNVRLSH